MLNPFSDQSFTLVLTAIVEIFVLTYVFYRLILAIRGTRGVPTALGIVIVVVVYLFSAPLGLQNIHWMIGQAAPYAALALIIIFQGEIRNVLRQMALHLFSPRQLAGVREDEYEDVIFALSQLSQARVGALIVLERETGLRTFIQSGVALDARLSSDLLVSIFQRRSPLHDGAVIIQRGRIAAAACFLPLTTNPGLISTLGTRHRAAIGVTEESDCVTLVVSEVSGRISLATGGNIELGVSLDRVRVVLYEYFGPVVSRLTPEEEKPPLQEKAEAAAAFVESSHIPEHREAP